MRLRGTYLLVLTLLLSSAAGPGLGRAEADAEGGSVADAKPEAPAENDAAAASVDGLIPRDEDTEGASVDAPVKASAEAGAASRISLFVDPKKPDDPPTSSSQAAPEVPSADLSVVQLTSRTFGAATGDGNAWLIEFYADWCSHCTAFAGTYAEVARHFHSQPKFRVRVAKVNVDRERALALRFGVHSFPSFFLVDGYTAYAFEQPRSKRSLLEFAAGGYRRQEPLPLLTSPVGPLGLAQGALVGAGLRLADAFAATQAALGVSPRTAGTLLFGAFFLGCFLLIVVGAVVLTPKAKAD